ncbi:MAG: PadR family transcriptional regulator [Bacteroidota bacterium]
MGLISPLTNKEAFILGFLIANQKGYGLQLVKASEGSLKRGTVYVTLLRMEEKGYIKSEEEELPEGDTRPPLRIYKITGKGSAAYDQWTIFVSTVQGNLKLGRV